MTTIFAHPEVERYLGDLDRALAVLSDDDAADLRDQVRAHIEDALAPDASDGDVAAILQRLGPPHDLVADGTAEPATKPAVVYTRPSFSGWLGQRSRKWWSAIAAIVVVVAAGATAIAVETNIAPVQGGCMPCGFLFAADRDHVRSTSADDVDEDTVPVRFRADQAITFTISNPSDYTQRVLGDRPDPDQGTPTHLQISTVARFGDGDAFAQWPNDYARDVSIPAHESRQVVLHWVQNFCPQPDFGTTIDSYDIRVRAVGVTRTETVHIGVAFSVVGSGAPGHCRYGSWANRGH